MKRFEPLCYVALFLCAALWCWRAPVFARQPGVGTDVRRLHNSAALTASGAITATYGAVSDAQNFAVAYRATRSGGNPNYKVELIASLDGTNYAIPQTGGTIQASVTDFEWHNAIITPPSGVAIGVVMTELGGFSTNVTLDVGSK